MNNPIAPDLYPTAVFFEVDMKLHRGWSDRSGRFTLEQCNLSKANAINNLQALTEAEAADIVDRCEWCFPA